MKFSRKASTTKNMEDAHRKLSSMILFVFLLVAPLLVYWAGRAVGTNSNRLSDWLPSNLVETIALQNFNAWFGDGQFVVVSWEGCRIDTTVDPSESSKDDPRLERLANMLSPKLEYEPTKTLLNESQVPTTELTEMVLRGPSNFDKATTPSTPIVDESLVDTRDDSVLSKQERRLYFRKVETTRTLLQKLTKASLGIKPAEAVKRLSGTVLGHKSQACCIVFLSEYSEERLNEAIGFRRARWIDPDAPQGALFRALQACDIPLESVHLGGPPIDNLSINEEGQRTLIRLALAAGGLGLLLAWWSLRSVALTLIVFLCGIVSTCGATAAIWVFGCHADAIVLAMPSLIYVLTISGAIHLVNYYREAVSTGGIPGAAARALAAGYKPAVLCSITTAIGLLSLFASDLTPICRFGVFSALGMVLMLVVLFLLLPAALEYFGRKRAFGFAIASGSADTEIDAAGNGSGALIERWAGLWAHWVIRHHRSVCLAGVVLMVGLSGGIGRIHTSVDLLKLFDSKTRILADYHYLEDNLGNLVPLEVLVRFDASMIGQRGPSATDGRLTLLNRARIVDHIRTRIDVTFGDEGQNLISPSMSTAAFLPVLPSSSRGTAAGIRNRILNSKLEQNFESLVSSGYLTIDPQTGDELWRISLRVAAFKNVDYGRFAEEVKAVVDPLLSQASAKIAARPGLADVTPIMAIHTGAIPIVYKAQRALLESLIESTVWSFLTITPLLMWATRGIAAGLIAMLPNILPVLAVFGSMGWLGISVDIGCMMTASIALGVAVDDTIHFLCWFRHGQQTCPNRSLAIESAFRSCCRPTLQAALINGLGLSVFLFSTFVPTKQFGLLMLVILTCGAVAELVLLPAILASPLGRYFEISRSSPDMDRRQHRLRLSALRIRFAKQEKDTV